MSVQTLAIRGLFQDAALQVLDNRVFRVLVVLALFPILATFLVGLNETSFSFVFGLWEVDYPSILAGLGEDPRAVMIELMLEFVINGLAGSVGITVCVAATAFFVPRMLEKGSADLVFTKPIARVTLYLSRYITGLFFISFLGIFLTTGMYLGVLLVSGISYTGILWSTLTLVYVFSLVHGVTMLIGLFTRSTPAAMILGILFFFGNGCVHSGWQMAGFFESIEALEASPDADEEEASKWKAVIDGALATLNTVHYILPKTSDAPLVTLQIQNSLFPNDRQGAREGMSEAFSQNNSYQVEISDDGTTTTSTSRDPDSNAARGGPDMYFENRFAWDAEDWRFNVWFSILSSLAFTLIVLGIGCLRIRRIDL